MYSQNVTSRIESPKNRISENELDSFFEHFGDHHFAYAFKLPNSNGEIKLVGEVDPDRPNKIKKCNYFTTVSGLALAYLDGMTDLISKMEWPYISVKLKPREIESYLRDKNEERSFPENELIVLKIHELLPGLEDYLKERFSFEKSRKSPQFKNENAIPYLDQIGIAEPYSSLPQDMKVQVLNEIADKYIAPFLQVDGGGIEICYVGDGMVSLEYVGNCSDCGQSLGSTLDFIQKTIRFHAKDIQLLVLTDS